MPASRLMAACRTFSWSGPAFSALRLAILSERNTPAARLLENAGITRERVNDAVINLRAGPSKGQAVLNKLETDTYLTIIDGPVKNGDGVWWKVHADFGDPNEGWVLENQTWYARSHP